LLLLQILRGALLGAGGLALGTGVALANEGGHESLTYVVWFVVAAVLLIAGVICWFGIHRSTASADGATVLEVADQSINITTQGQSGGTNIGQLNVAGAHPVLSGEELAHHEKVDDGFKTVVALNLRDQFAAEALEVAVEGTTVKSIEVRPDVPASITSQSSVPTTPAGGGVVTHPPLHGRYLVTVLTDQPDPSLKIKPQLLVR
jgi:hypothetical protein